MPERSAYAPELPQKLEAEFSGFTPDQQEAVEETIESTGFPTDNVNLVDYKEAKRGEEDILGTFELYYGKLSLYKSLEKLPLIAQGGTVAHEMAHSVSPLNDKNDRLFGGREQREAARDHVAAIAGQSIATRTYLNGYQAHLHRQLEADEIDESRFVEETFAIMVELRFTNPEHLKEVEKAQIAALKEINKGNKERPAIMPVALMTGGEAQRGSVSGIDRTISNLIPALKTKEDIDAHVANFRRKLLERGKPMLPNQVTKAA